MCYPKPGPRCSSHAAKSLAQADKKLNEVRSSSETNKSVNIRKCILAQNNAQHVFDSTPLGLTELKELISKEKSSHILQELKRRYDEGSRLRASQLKAYHALKLSQTNRGDSSSDNLLMRSTLKENFENQEQSRVGWRQDSPEFKENARLLIKSSKKWTQKLTEEQKESIRWFTYIGSNLMSIEAALENDPDVKSEEVESLFHPYIKNDGREVYERNKQNVISALSLAPRLKRPVVLYRGIGKDHQMSVEEIVREGSYTISSPASTTLNPSIANNFWNKRVILEIKTRQFGSPVSFTSVGTSEEEVMLSPGTKLKVINVIDSAEFNSNWSEEKDYSTVIQLEEIE